MICTQNNGYGYPMVMGSWSPGANCNYVILEPSEAETLYTILQNPPKPNPFNDLSAAEGGVIAVAIIAVWAVGFSFREIARLFLDRHDDEI